MFSKLTASSLLLLANLAQAQQPTVKVGGTTVIGAAFDDVEFYGGIPYAEPPVGHKRFTPPVLHRLNTRTFNATTYGSPCLQDPTDNPGAVPTSSEDCLTINVYRPAGVAHNASLPVMAWFHGGGLVAGASTTYNATFLVKQSVARGTPVVYVSFNYRLGVLGFATGREAYKKKLLNLGLKDQLTALKWIQKNIGAFNGDKSKVTVFGESAGAIALAILYMNSNLENLARAAIFQSGTPSSTGVFDHGRNQADWDNFVRAVPGCAHSLRSNDSIACLQRANSSSILQATITASVHSGADYPWGPVIDGKDGIVPDLPSVLLEKGQFTRIPVIMGTNLDEGTFFTTPLTNSTEMIRSFIISNYTAPTVPAQKLEATVDKLLELYPDVPALGSPFNTGNETFGLSSQYKRYAAIMGDLMFQAQHRAFIQAVSKFGVKSFGYLFTEPAPPIVIPALGGHPAMLAALGVTHTADITFIYGENQFFPGSNSASAIELSTHMVDYWVSFATSLDPNDGLGSARPAWGQYTCGEQMLLQLNGNNTVMIPDTFRAEQFAHINSDPVVFDH